jgi:hypothetical protein
LVAAEAAGVALWLLPFLSLLTGVGEGVAASATEAGLAKARRGWDQLTEAANEDGEEVLAQLVRAASRAAQAPDDQDAIAAFRLAVRDVLESRPDLAVDLASSANDGISVGPVAGVGNAVEAGDMYASPVVHGEHNTVSGTINIGTTPKQEPHDQ